MNDPAYVVFFPNGMAAVFDGDDHQLSELQGTHLETAQALLNHFQARQQKQKHMSNQYGLEIGDRAKDRITGYEGIVIALTNQIDGNCWVTVQSEKLKDNSPVKAEGFDAVRMQIVQKGAFVATGGPDPRPAH